MGDHWSLCLLRSRSGRTTWRTGCWQSSKNTTQKHYVSAPNDGQPDCECIECQKKLIQLNPELTGELNNRGVMHGKSWTPLVLGQLSADMRTVFSKKYRMFRSLGLSIRNMSSRLNRNPEKCRKILWHRCVPCWTALRTDAFV